MGREGEGEGATYQRMTSTHGKGGVSSTDEGAVRGTSALQMRRVAQTAGCVVVHVLQPAGADVPGGHGRDDGGGGAGWAAVPHL